MNLNIYGYEGKTISSSFEQDPKSDFRFRTKTSSSLENITFIFKKIVEQLEKKSYNIHFLKKCVGSGSEKIAFSLRVGKSKQESPTQEIWDKCQFFLESSSKPRLILLFPKRPTKNQEEDLLSHSMVLTKIQQDIENKIEPILRKMPEWEKRDLKDICFIEKRLNEESKESFFYEDLKKLYETYTCLSHCVVPRPFLLDRSLFVDHLFMGDEPLDEQEKAAKKLFKYLPEDSEISVFVTKRCDFDLTENNRFSLKEKIGFLITISLVLKYFNQELCLQHRDLSLKNILIKKDFSGTWKVFLSDFGKAGIRGKELPSILPRWQQAPETFLSQEHEKSEIFSFGLLFLELLSPCYSLNSQDKANWTKKFKECYKQNLLPSEIFIEIQSMKTWIQKKFSDNNLVILFENFLDGCFVLDPEKRLSHEQLKSYLETILQKIDNQENEFPLKQKGKSLKSSAQ